MKTEMYMDLIKHHLATAKASDAGVNGWVLDGFPWTMDQAQALYTEGLVPHYLIPISDTDDATSKSRCGQPWFSLLQGPEEVQEGEAYPGGLVDGNVAIDMLPFLKSWMERLKVEHGQIQMAYEARDMDVVAVPVHASQDDWFSALTFALNPLAPKACANNSFFCFVFIFSCG